MAEPMQVAEGQLTPKIICPIWTCCSNEFSTNRALVAHLLNDTKVKQYPCPLEGCMAQFAKLDSLYRHLVFGDEMHQGYKESVSTKCLVPISSHRFSLGVLDKIIAHKHERHECAKLNCDFVGKSPVDLLKHYFEFDHLRGCHVNLVNLVALQRVAKRRLDEMQANGQVMSMVVDQGPVGGPREVPIGVAINVPNIVAEDVPIGVTLGEPNIEAYNGPSGVTLGEPNVDAYNGPSGVARGASNIVEVRGPNDIVLGVPIRVAQGGLIGLAPRVPNIVAPEPPNGQDEQLNAVDVEAEAELNDENRAEPNAEPMVEDNTELNEEANFVTIPDLEDNVAIGAN